MLSPFTCPECHGMLLQIQEGGIRRFRCHTGHAYSLNSLFQDVTESVEESAWNAMRAMDELLLLLRHLEDQAQEQGDTVTAARIAQKGYDIYQRIELVRQALQQPETLSEERSSTELDAA
jgi:two-component system, chemotaxis family, protein-glutamate methylesterase/glutaminase